MMSIYPGVSQLYTPRHSVRLRYPCISIRPSPPIAQSISVIPVSAYARPRRSRLFSQCKIILTARRNRLQIDSLQAVECIKSWDALQIGLPRIVVTGDQLEDAGKAELDIDQAEDENMDIRYLLRMCELMWKSCKVRERGYDFGNYVTSFN